MVTILNFYIADFSIPNRSAYTVHVLKICDNFVKNGVNLTLLFYILMKKIFHLNFKKKIQIKRKFQNKILF